MQLEKGSCDYQTTIMSENIEEIEDIVKLAKELGVRISLSVAYEYHSANGCLPKSGQTVKVVQKLIEMRKKGYPLVNSTNYFRVVAKEKNWKCKPWALINVGTDGKLVLPCYVQNQYYPAESVSGHSIKAAIGSFDWKKTSNCVKCNLHCYVEPSLVLSWDLRTYFDWAFRAKHS